MKRFFFCVLFSVSNFLFAAEPNRLEEYYSKAVPASENFVKRLVKDGKAEPWENLGVRNLIDNVYILSMARIDLPEEKRPNEEQIVPLLNLAEEMQDKNPESRTFGNFRWYWRTPEVTDRNAVEFVAAHALPVWFEARDRLTPEARLILGRMLRRSVDGCMKHDVRSDYTNIAIFNFVHLILLGQAFDRPDAVREGEKRLREFMVAVWDHGAFEYNSPTYYTVDLDALQLGLRYAQKSTTKRALRVLLDYFWTDLSLNWYTPSLRMAGAQSRTYDYLYGRGGIGRWADFNGLAPVDRNARHAEYLNAFHAAYKPSAEILKLNAQYPRFTARRWGASPGQWAKTSIFKDIALGTAGAPYMRARQNMPLTVDLADYDAMPREPPKHLPRCYFIADGREDPYGTKRYPTSGAGHQKALHMEAFWMGAQRTVDALGIALYTKRTLDDPVLTDVQSHFVFRKPDAIVWEAGTIVPASEPFEIGEKPVVFRYGSKAFGIRVPWTRDRDGRSPKAYLIDDGNTHGVFRLTVDHWGPRSGDVSPRTVSYEGLAASPGAAFWVRIGSQLDTDEKFKAWMLRFFQANVERVEVDGDDVAIHVAGVDGPVSIEGTALNEVDGRIVTEPPEPEGILMLGDRDLGRPILERLPAMAAYVSRLRSVKPIPIDAEGTIWEAQDGFGFFGNMVESNDGASGGKAVRVHSEISWDLQIKEKGDYYLWARVFAADPESDSFFVSCTKKEPNGFSARFETLGDWHIGSGPTWRWIRLKLRKQNEPFPLKLEPGIRRFSLRPREPDGMVDRFFLTKDPERRPPGEAP